MVIFGKKYNFIKLVLLALVIIFSCTGITYAWWTDGLELTGKVEMGCVDAQLISVDVETLTPDFHYNLLSDYEPETNVITNIADDSAQFDITGVKQGFIYKITYVIYNDGTIPIMLQIPRDFYNPGLLIDYEPIRIEPKTQGTAKITITVLDEENMHFNIPLTFVQAVGIKEVDL